MTTEFNEQSITFIAPGKYEELEKQLYSRWCNSHLPAPRPQVTDLIEDLKDGTILYNLLEELTGQDMRAFGKLNPRASMKMQYISNLSISFKYLRTITKLVGIGEQDVADGKETLVLGLMWSIMVYFMSRDVDGLVDLDTGDDGASSSERLKLLKASMLLWTQRCLAGQDIEVNDLSRSFADGKVLMALVSTGRPDLMSFDPCEAPVDTIQAVMDVAEASLGVYPLVRAEELANAPSDRQLLPYLVALRRALPANPTPAPRDWVRDRFFDEENSLQERLAAAEATRLAAEEGAAAAAAEAESKSRDDGGASSGDEGEAAGSGAESDSGEPMSARCGGGEGFGTEAAAASRGGKTAVGVSIASWTAVRFTGKWGKRRWVRKLLVLHGARLSWSAASIKGGDSSGDGDVYLDRGSVVVPRGQTEDQLVLLLPNAVRVKLMFEHANERDAWVGRLRAAGGVTAAGWTGKRSKKNNSSRQRFVQLQGSLLQWTAAPETKEPRFINIKGNGTTVEVHPRDASTFVVTTDGYKRKFATADEATCAQFIAKLTAQL